MLSTVFYAEYNNRKLNFFDCPGMDDFVGNAVTALNVTDAGVILVNGQYGVEVGTQNIFRTASSIKKPIIFAINKLDTDTADYDNVLNQLKDTFGPKVVPVQFPVATGPGFNAVIDVLLMKKYSQPSSACKCRVLCSRVLQGVVSSMASFRQRMLSGVHRLLFSCPQR